MLTALSLVGCSNDNNDTMQESPITWTECSQNIDDHPCNFTLLDQNNEERSLYDFYGKVIVLDFSAMWCGPCKSAASHIQETADNNDVHYITVLIENSYGMPPELEDAQTWVNMFSITSEPVLMGSRDMLSSDPELGWPLTSWPAFFFITPDMKIKFHQKGFNQQTIDALIEETGSATEEPQ